MTMRQATRQELQAQVTVIRPHNNNPLKFAPDGQSALEQVLAAARCAASCPARRR